MNLTKNACRFPAHTSIIGREGLFYGLLIIMQDKKMVS
jgi:hypothetical protein